MIVFVCDWMVIQAIASALLCTAVGSREVSRASSNTFLNTRVSPRRKYEESVERIETTREVSDVSCIVQRHRPSASFALTSSERRTRHHLRLTNCHVVKRRRVLKRYPLCARSTAVKLSIASKAMVGVHRVRGHVRVARTSLEQTACLDPTWPSKGVRFVQKVNRMCYVRVTKIQRYHEAEKTCQDLGLSLAVIDNLALLEKLKELNLCKTEELRV